VTSGHFSVPCEIGATLHGILGDHPGRRAIAQVVYGCGNGREDAAEQCPWS
jgi:hypothetical protein